MFLYNSRILGSLQLKQINKLSGEATATCAEGGLSVSFVKGEASVTGGADFCSGQIWCWVLWRAIQRGAQDGYKPWLLRELPFQTVFVAGWPVVEQFMVAEQRVRFGYQVTSDSSTPMKLGKTPAWQVLHRLCQGLRINKLTFAGRETQAITEDGECPEIFLSNVNKCAVSASCGCLSGKEGICFNRPFSPGRGSVHFPLLVSAGAEDGKPEHPNNGLTVLVHCTGENPHLGSERITCNSWNQGRSKTSQAV